MMLIFLCISISQASISMPIHKRPSSSKDVPISSHFIINPSLRGLSSSSLSNYEDFQYYTQASIGTPAQTFTFIVDTGSTWIWIDSADGCSGCHSGNKFSPGSSSTYKNTTQVKSLAYLKGSSNGYLSTDSISIGDSNALAVTDQSFILVYSESSFDNLDADGLMGFGFEELSDGVSSLMSTLKTQGKIQNKQFAIYLSEENTYSDLKDMGNSNLMIDGNDIEKYSTAKSFTYIDLVVNSGYWEVTCDSMTFDGVSYYAATSAIIDTGTSTFVGPKSDVNQILSTLYYTYNCLLDSASYVYCDCSKTYPTLTFTFSGNTFVLKQSDYFKVYSGYCYPLFYYADGLYSWVLGDSFIRRFYINFDMDGKRIGFAKMRTTKDSDGSGTDNGGGGSGGDQDSSDNEDSGGSSGFAGWKIALIVVLPSVAIIVLAIVIGIKIYKTKAKGKDAREPTPKPEAKTENLKDAEKTLTDRNQASANGQSNKATEEAKNEADPISSKAKNKGNDKEHAIEEYKDSQSNSD